GLPSSCPLHADVSELAQESCSAVSRRRKDSRNCGERNLAAPTPRRPRRSSFPRLAQQLVRRRVDRPERLRQRNLLRQPCAGLCPESASWGLIPWFARNES